MTQRHIYPLKLELFIREENHQFIPRKMKAEEHLRLYKKYWNNFGEYYFKVTQIYKIEDVEYYSVKYLNSLFGEVSYPLNTEMYYELNNDKNGMKDIDSIINTKISYTGAEIKYWFFVHDIDLSSGEYSGFWSFLDQNSISSISDDKKYFVFASYKNEKYKDCKISLDKTIKQ